jgi:hypothetical protein
VHPRRRANKRSWTEKFRIRGLAAILLAATALTAQAVHSAPLTAANRARLQGCGVSGARAPLFYSLKLEQAAKGYSQGSSLQKAAVNSGYLAAEIAGIHLSGPTSDAEVEQMLMRGNCHTLQDPKMREFAAVQRQLLRGCCAAFARPDAHPGGPTALA